MIVRPKPKRRSVPTPRIGILRAASKTLAVAGRRSRLPIAPKPRFVKG